MKENKVLMDNAIRLFMDGMQSKEAEYRSRLDATISELSSMPSPEEMRRELRQTEDEETKQKLKMRILEYQSLKARKELREKEYLTLYKRHQAEYRMFRDLYDMGMKGVEESTYNHHLMVEIPTGRICLKTNGTMKGFAEDSDFGFVQLDSLSAAHLFATAPRHKVGNLILAVSHDAALPNKSDTIFLRSKPDGKLVQITVKSNSEWAIAAAFTKLHICEWISAQGYEVIEDTMARLDEGNVLIAVKNGDALAYVSIPLRTDKPIRLITRRDAAFYSLFKKKK